MSGAVMASPSLGYPRGGLSYWVESYQSMVRWQLVSLRLLLPTMAVIQVLAGVGFVLGFGLFFPGSVPQRSAVYLSTGVTVINLYILGLILCPQVVGQQKMAKTYEFLQSMPVPRAVGFMSWYSISLVVGAPAMVVSLAAAAIRYHLTYSVSIWVIPAVLLVSLCSTAIGYALGNAIGQPMVTQVVTQVLNFFAIGFAPICIPPDQLPSWLQTLNLFLPFESMAIVVRSALTSGGSDNIGAAYAVLGVWTLGCLLVAGWSVVRRG